MINPAINDEQLNNMLNPPIIDEKLNMINPAINDENIDEQLNNMNIAPNEEASDTEDEINENQLTTLVQNIQGDQNDEDDDESIAQQEARIRNLLQISKQDANAEASNSKKTSWTKEKRSKRKTNVDKEKQSKELTAVKQAKKKNLPAPMHRAINEHFRLRVKTLPTTMLEGIKFMTGDQNDAVVDMGFGAFLNMKLEQSPVKLGHIHRRYTYATLQKLCAYAKLIKKLYIYNFKKKPIYKHKKGHTKLT
ncbi:hypothetical protein LXL04_039145 [Taraxacum kok-saghyz]